MCIYFNVLEYILMSYKIQIYLFNKRNDFFGHGFQFYLIEFSAYAYAYVCVCVCVCICVCVC